MGLLNTLQEDEDKLLEDSGMSSDQSTTPENNLSQRPTAVYDVSEAKKVGEVEDTDDSDLNNSFQTVIITDYIGGQICSTEHTAYSARSGTTKKLAL